MAGRCARGCFMTSDFSDRSMVGNLFIYVFDWSCTVFELKQKWFSSNVLLKLITTRKKECEEEEEEERNEEEKNKNDWKKNTERKEKKKRNRMGRWKGSGTFTASATFFSHGNPRKIGQKSDRKSEYLRKKDRPPSKGNTHTLTHTLTNAHTHRPIEIARWSVSSFPGSGTGRPHRARWAVEFMAGTAASSITWWVGFFFSLSFFSLFFFFEGFFYCRPAQLHLPAWRAISDASATRGRRRNYKKWWQNLPNGKKTALKNPTADRRFFCVIFGRIQIDALVRSLVFFWQRGLVFFLYIWRKKTPDLSTTRGLWGSYFIFGVTCRSNERTMSFRTAECRKKNQTTSVTMDMASICGL